MILNVGHNMVSKMSDRGRWLLAALLLTIGSIIFAFGWTAPFWPAWVPLLGSDLFKTTYFFISSGIFIGLLIYSLFLLLNTTPPPTKSV